MVYWALETNYRSVARESVHSLLDGRKDLSICRYGKCIVYMLGVRKYLSVVRVSVQFIC